MPYLVVNRQGSGLFCDTKYRGLNAEEAWQSVESLLATVKRYGGCIVLLWHNSHLDEFEHADYTGVYERTLEWVAENNGLGMSARSLLWHSQRDW